jgi:uncharacterized membrane protein
MRFSKRIIVTCIVSIYLYVITNFILKFITGETMDEFTTLGWFGFFGGELLLSCIVKVIKVKKTSTESEE